MASDYSTPIESRKIFEKEILENPLLPNLPKEINEVSKLVRFEGNEKPSIPVNWRFAESISALKAFEASLLIVLLIRKYETEPVKVNINTDHASLFIMSPMLTQIVKPDGDGFESGPWLEEMMKLFPNADKHRSSASLHRTLATNICETKDGRYYHCHGSLNPEPTIKALKLPLEGKEGDTYDEVVTRYQEAVAKLNSKDLDALMNDENRQAGTIAYTSEEYLKSEHGKRNGKVGLYTVQEHRKISQPASWWPETSETSPKRPLSGLKVVDLTRVIAGPAITRGLAEMGASIMRVTAPHITDMSAAHQDLNWGKWNCQLDLRSAEDRDRLIALIKEADVVVDGYRPGVMDKWGFGREAVLDMVRDRERGIIHVRENCYGWDGPWKGRSGWQQISDACCGVSIEYGRAMGHDEPVTPVFPNSDYCTGVAGTCGVLQALIERGEKGGSYGVDVSLNYYSQWLVLSCGMYPAPIWDEVWAKHGQPVFRHYHSMSYTIPEVMKMLYKNCSETLFQPQFFEHRESKAVDRTFRQVKPIAQFPGSEVELRYNVGTRGNGVDKPYWPEDLSVEIVA